LLVDMFEDLLNHVRLGNGHNDTQPATALRTQFDIS
jgi:hypothetical protein